MSAILKFDFQKTKTITFFWSKLSKLHKKDPILHVATTFSPTQGEIRINHGPIPHPLRVLCNVLRVLVFFAENEKQLFFDFQQCYVKPEQVSIS